MLAIRIIDVTTQLTLNIISVPSKPNAGAIAKTANEALSRLIFKPKKRNAPEDMVRVILEHEDRGEFAIKDVGKGKKVFVKDVEDARREAKKKGRPRLF